MYRFFYNFGSEDMECGCEILFWYVSISIDDVHHTASSWDAHLAGNDFSFISTRTWVPEMDVCYKDC